MFNLYAISLLSNFIFRSLLQISSHVFFGSCTCIILLLSINLSIYLVSDASFPLGNSPKGMATAEESLSPYPHTLFLLVQSFLLSFHVTTGLPRLLGSSVLFTYSVCFVLMHTFMAASHSVRDVYVNYATFSLCYSYLLFRDEAC